MKKLNLKLDEIKERLSREQMKKVMGGGSGGGSNEGGSGGFCNYHCCGEDHMGCSQYVPSTLQCLDADSCANNPNVSCPDGHLFWKCF